MIYFTFQLFVMAIVIVNVIVFLLIKHWSILKKEIEYTEFNIKREHYFVGFFLVFFLCPINCCINGMRKCWIQHNQKPFGKVTHRSDSSVQW